MTRHEVAMIAVRRKFDARQTDALIEEYSERMAIAVVEGGQNEADADVIAMADVERRAVEIAAWGACPGSPA